MRITIHRGTDQIGGCVTEYSHDGWHLFVDYGEQLPGAPKATESLEIDGLTHGDVSKSALLITHYHADHIGRIAELPADIPVFMGGVAKEIALTFANRMGVVFDDKKLLAVRIRDAGTFSPGKEFEFGPFSVMPIVIDHSAFDAYAFKIEAGEVSVFHTGDFRTHGFRSAKLPKLLDRYIGAVNYVVCEATNVSRPDVAPVTEKQLFEEFVEELKTHAYNIVYVSSTNVDRLFALYRAACLNGRIFLVDTYQKRIMDIVTERDPLWGKSRYYKYDPAMPPCVVEYHDGRLKIAEDMMPRLETSGYVLAARASEKFGSIISNLPGAEKSVYLSMWSGYIDESRACYSPALAASVGDNYKYMHTSGHCDMSSLEDVLRQLKPKAIIPIHTDDPQAFARLFSERWPVILLADGESIEPVSSFAVDSTTANMYLKGESVGDKCWKLESKKIGCFNTICDAQYVLKHTIYAPSRVVGYAAEEEEDNEAFHYVTMDRRHNKIAEYTYGGHCPGGKHYQEPCIFKPGDKVIAVIFECRDLVMEGEVIGPVDEDLMWQYLKAADCIFDSFDEYRDYMRDWDWDCVAIKPLCDPSSTTLDIHSLETPQRIYLFPLEE